MGGVRTSAIQQFEGQTFGSGSIPVTWADLFDTVRVGCKIRWESVAKCSLKVAQDYCGFGCSLSWLFWIKLSTAELPRTPDMHQATYRGSQKLQRQVSNETCHFQILPCLVPPDVVAWQQRITGLHLIHQKSHSITGSRLSALDPANFGAGLAKFSLTFRSVEFDAKATKFTVLSLLRRRNHRCWCCHHWCLFNLFVLARFCLQERPIQKTL